MRKPISKKEEEEWQDACVKTCKKMLSNEFKDDKEILDYIEKEFSFRDLVITTHQYLTSKVLVKKMISEKQKENQDTMYV